VKSSRRRKANLAIAVTLFSASLLFVLANGVSGQSAQTPSNDMEMSGTSTDLFVMMGSDFVRPGLAPKANYNIGIGHTFGFLKKDPIGDELTFSYTYEDGGSGFWHSDFGSHTEAAFRIISTMASLLAGSFTSTNTTQCGSRTLSTKLSRYLGTRPSASATHGVGSKRVKSKTEALAILIQSALNILEMCNGNTA
jgi:hypothetical protein